MLVSTCEVDMWGVGCIAAGEPRRGEARRGEAGEPSSLSSSLSSSSSSSSSLVVSHAQVSEIIRLGDPATAVIAKGLTMAQVIVVVTVVVTVVVVFF